MTYPKHTKAAWQEYMGTAPMEGRIFNVWLNGWEAGLMYEPPCHDWKGTKDNPVWSSTCAVCGQTTTDDYDYACPGPKRPEELLVQAAVRGSDGGNLVATDAIKKAESRK